jgi:hypothetical protein
MSEIVAADYLRAAQAYMLISMPTGTSTIFGAFQAIMALLFETGRTCALSIKLQREENFASEIFGDKPPRFCFYCNAMNASPKASPIKSNQTRKGSRSSRSTAGGRLLF